MSAALQAGDRFAQRYRIVRPLGEGGMGAVYLTTDELLGEDVALKIAAGIITDDPDRAFARQRREVSLARRVTHPHVARVFDLGVDGGDGLAGTVVSGHYDSLLVKSITFGQTLQQAATKGRKASH